ncbi:1-aminocyclopropane-1-carboxylate synthase-like protein 1 isoform X2 [Anguilla rostrata]|uniref:1-aminocyclopropane-1-carboxylate synthase-like protein 1 isoform X2 n=1 Tax=Anguilla rostrata TaxID=7938 RepID=UPI0030D1E0FA
MDFRGKKYERGSDWSDPEVAELLHLWADDSVQIELESCLRNQHVFNRIAEVLREKGILRTGDECREKIKKMKLDYRRIKDNQKTVRGGRTWKFYEVMDRVLNNRPPVSYSSLGGTVTAHQVLQGTPASDAFLLHNIPAAAFSSPSSGSLLFGHPPKPGDLLEIKREDVDSDNGLLNSDPQPPELLYQIEPDADSKSLGLDQEDLAEMGRGEGVANARFSPSGFSDQNMPVGSASSPSCPLGSAPKPARPPGPAEPERDPPAPPDSACLSSRGHRMCQHQGMLQEGFLLYQKDKHHFTSNRNGIVNLGTSENKLCYDLLSKRLMQADMLHMDPALLEYPDRKGHSFLREEVASFLTEYCKAPSPLEPENVVVMSGCSSLFSSIAAVTCDPGDAILVPTPFYGAIREDVALYSGVRLVHSHLDCQPGGGDDRPFLLTVEKLEKSMEQAKAEGVRVRAVIFVNPHNPLGEIYSAEEMTAFLEFAKRNALHAIVDEVYMLSVFDESASFRSVLSFDRLPDVQRTHVMWGMSKDFAAAGLRMGVVYSQNQDFVLALTQLAFYHGIPGPAQHQVAQLLRDRDWVSRKFLPQNRARMAAAHRYVSGALRGLGIPYLHRPSGFYIWADFRKALSEQSFLAERKLWQCFVRHKVLVSPGEAFACAMPGWFRIIFTDQEERLQLGMQRLRKALEELGRVSGQGAENGDEKAGLQSTADEAEPKRDGHGPPAAPPSVATCAASSLADEDFVTLDLQAAQPAAGSALDSLIGTLRQQIRSPDWLEKNTPELSAGEDPELLGSRDLLQHAHK